MAGNIPEYTSSGNTRSTVLSPISTNFTVPESLDLSPVTKLASNVIDRVTEQATKKKNLEDSMWALKSMSSIQQQYIKYNAEAMTSATPGAPDHTKNTIEWYDRVTNEVLRTAPSPEAKTLLERNVIQHKDEVFAKSVAFETQSRVEKMNNDWLSTLDENKNILLHDPTQWRQTYHNITTNPIFSQLPQDVQKKTKEELAMSTIMGKLNTINMIGNDDLQRKEQAYESLNKELTSGSWDSYLDANTQFNLMGKVQQQIQSHKDDMYSSQLQFVQSVWDDHVSSVQQTGVGVIPEETVKFLAKQTNNPLLYDRYVQDTKDAKDVYSVMKNIDLNNPQQAFAKIQELSNIAPGDPHYASKFKTFTTAKKIYDESMKAVISDPAEYSLAKDTVKAAFSRSDKEGILTSLGTQAKFGLPEYSQKILAKSQAVAMVKEINNMNPDQLEQYFDDLHKKYNFNIGNGMTAYDKIFEELHGLPQENKLNGIYSIVASTTGSSVSNDLIKAVKQGPALKAALPPGTSYDMILKQVKSNLYQFSKSVGARDAGSTDMSDLYNASTYLAMQYLNSGKAGDPGTAAQMATKNLVLDNYDIKTSPKNSRYTFHIPKQINDVEINTTNVYNFLKEKQNIKDLSYFIGKNNFNDFATVTPKPNETKQLTYYADTYLKNLGDKLGTTFTVVNGGRYRPDKNYHSLHSEGKAIDISMSEHDVKTRYETVKSELSNPLVKSIGTSDPNILAAFKGNPKLHDMTDTDNNPKFNTNHKNHVHVVLDTSANLGNLMGTLDPLRSSGDIVKENINGAVNKGFWVTNRNGTGAYLMVELKDGRIIPLYNGSGQRYEFGFREASKKGSVN